MSFNNPRLSMLAFGIIAWFGSWISLESTAIGQAFQSFQWSARVRAGQREEFFCDMAPPFVSKGPFDWADPVDGFPWVDMDYQLTYDSTGDEHQFHFQCSVAAANFGCVGQHSGGGGSVQIQMTALEPIAFEFELLTDPTIMFDNCSEGTGSVGNSIHSSRQNWHGSPCPDVGQDQPFVHFNNANVSVIRLGTANAETILVNPENPPIPVYFFDIVTGLGTAQGTLAPGTYTFLVGVGAGTVGSPPGLGFARYTLTLRGDFLLGDVNCDGVVSLLDISPFVELVTTGAFSHKADMNQDGVVDLLDVAPFIAVLTGG